MLRLAKSLFVRLCCRRAGSGLTRLFAGSDDLDYSYSKRRYGFNPDEPENSPTPFNETFPEDTIIVYTDGSYSQKKCEGSYVAFFGHQNPFNRSVRINSNEGCWGDGMQLKLKDLGEDAAPTFMEIQAVRLAIDQLTQWRSGNLCFAVQYRPRSLIIRTDSIVLIEGLRGCYHNFNDAAATKEIENRIKALKRQMVDLKVQFTVQHVKSHHNDPGNSWADYYARGGHDVNGRPISGAPPLNCGNEAIYYKNDGKPVVTSTPKKTAPSSSKSPSKSSSKSPSKSSSANRFASLCLGPDKTSQATKKSAAQSASDTPNRKERDAAARKEELEMAQKKAEQDQRDKTKINIISSWKWAGTKYEPEASLPYHEQWDEARITDLYMNWNNKKVTRSFTLKRQS